MQVNLSSKPVIKNIRLVQPPINGFVENLLESTAGKIRAPNKLSPKAQILSLMLSFSC